MQAAGRARADAPRAGVLRAQETRARVAQGEHGAAQKALQGLPRSDELMRSAGKVLAQLERGAEKLGGPALAPLGYVRQLAAMVQAPHVAALGAGLDLAKKLIRGGDGRER